MTRKQEGTRRAMQPLRETQRGSQRCLLVYTHSVSGEVQTLPRTSRRQIHAPQRSLLPYHHAAFLEVQNPMERHRVGESCREVVVRELTRHVPQPRRPRFLRRRRSYRRTWAVCLPCGSPVSNATD